MTGLIHTVRGPVPAEDIGFTLPHEHTYVYLWRIEERFDYATQTESEDVLAAELEEFRTRGGSCLVDLTLPGMGRDAARVKALSERTGVHIVLGCGYYREPYYPPGALVDRRSVGAIADDLVEEIENGIDGTGIRPGILGEIGTHKPWISAQEERVHRAVARAQRLTGLSITTHSVLSRVGLDQLQLFLEEGADPSRIIIGHCDGYPDLDYYLELLNLGASIEFDGLGYNAPYLRFGEPMILGLLLELLERRLESQILLSQDVCTMERLKRFGGNGYSYLQEAIVPKLREAGVTDDLIDTLTVENPRRLLSVG